MQRENSVTKGPNIAAEINALCHQLTCPLKAFRAQLLKDQMDRPVRGSFNTGQVLLVSERNQHFRGKGVCHYVYVAPDIPSDRHIQFQRKCYSRLESNPQANVSQAGHARLRRSGRQSEGSASC